MLGELGLIAIDQERNRRGGIKSFSALSSHTPPSLVRRPRAGRARWSCSSSSEPSSAHTGCVRVPLALLDRVVPRPITGVSCCPCAYRRPRHRATTALFLGGSRYVRVSLYGIVARETLLLPRIKACATHGQERGGGGVIVKDWPRGKGRNRALSPSPRSSAKEAAACSRYRCRARSRRSIAPFAQVYARLWDATMPSRSALSYGHQYCGGSVQHVRRLLVVVG